MNTKSYNMWSKIHYIGEELFSSGTIQVHKDVDVFLVGKDKVNRADWVVYITTSDDSPAITDHLMNQLTTEMYDLGLNVIEWEIYPIEDEKLEISIYLMEQ